MRSPRVLAALLATTTAVLAGCAEDPGSVAAADYPSEDIRLLVPYTAGGPTDIAARAVGAHLEEELGRPVVVENLPGASGATAYVAMLSAEPDGHTLSMTALPTAVLNYLSNDVGYTREDFAARLVEEGLRMAKHHGIFFVPFTPSFNNKDQICQRLRAFYHHLSR